MTDRPFEPAAAPYVSLRTFRRTGVPVDTPVWIAGDSTDLYVFSARNAGKIKRLRHTSRVSLARCDIKGNVTEPWISGEAELIPADTDLRAIHQAFVTKYGWQMRITNFFSRLTGRYRQRQWIRVAIASLQPES